MYKRQLLENLQVWKENPARKPLILRGARQVGKTTLIKMFSESFDHYIYLNLDKKQDLDIFDKNDNVHTIIKILFFKHSISPKKHSKILLFIDEIQNSSNAIKLLRYFYEEVGHIYVIAAGSLLETIIKDQVSFPVGRVEYLVLRPFSFTEFLLAKNEDVALEAIQTIPVPEYAHHKLLELFNEYCLIGGMPEIVANYLKYNDMVRLSKIFDSLITTYLDDVEKYAKNDHKKKIIRHIIVNAVKFAGKRIKFEGFAQSNYKSKDIGECFRVLEKAFILSLVYPTTSTRIPLTENLRKSPKLQFFDTGIVNKFAGAQSSILNNEMLDDVFAGKIAEHIVGQELLSAKPDALAKNTFWVREKRQSSAEVDYVIQINDLLVPVEVKTGKTGRLRSLMEFIDRSPHSFAIRIYSGKLSIEKSKTLKGKDFVLLNLPFYLISKIPGYFNWMST